MEREREGERERENNTSNKELIMKKVKYQLVTVNWKTKKP